MIYEQIINDISLYCNNEFITFPINNYIINGNI